MSRVTILSFHSYQDIVYEAEGGVFDTGSDQDESELSYYSDEERARDNFSCALAVAWTQETEFLSIDYLELKSAWDEAWNNWSQSSVCHELTDVFRRCNHMPKATKIVCFGLGSLEGFPGSTDLHIPADCDGLPCRSAMTQHAAALSIAAVVGEMLGTAPLSVIAQEPVYSPVAKRLLTELGIEVVEGYGSLAFTQVDDDAIVVACAPDIPVKQVVADIARPAAMVWNLVLPAKEGEPEWLFDLSGSIEMMHSPWSTDEDSPRTRKLVKDYVQYEFPAERERFSDMAIYIRKD
ncbi:hypothetical protein EDB81DRAFT_457776 [Dactylonectria macrodidyma]|uniref:SRR1-like domain-containing protein n=1 Tax=Dactylonectria macrodidyma TaxID=307937 RepID=A0A9P9EX94_9HYPO|nr:hypothetical protein EDB81DRAFT_457776 [Dactylonectria macrodidyma]